MLWIRVLALVSAVVLSACGGGNGSSDVPPPDPDPDDPIVVDPPPSRAVLGPLASATVRLYSVNDLSTPVESVDTRAGSSLDEIGWFTFPDTEIDAEDMYLIQVSGGQDWDVDDDGVLDTAPTANAGLLHALVSGDEIIAGNLRINIFTEILFRKVRQALAVNAPIERIASELDSLSKLLLKQDLTGDLVIDRRDVDVWDPRADSSASIPNDEMRALLASSILSNADDQTVFLQASDGVLAALPLDDIQVQLVQELGHHVVVVDYRYDSRPARVHVFDTSDPFKVIEVKVIELPGYRLAALNDSYLVYARPSDASEWVLGVIDLRDPVAASVLAERNIGAQFPLGIALKDDRIYFGSVDRLSIYQLNAGLNELGSVPIDLIGPGNSSAGAPGAVAVNSDYALLCDGVDGDVAVVDLDLMAQVDTLTLGSDVSYYGTVAAAVTASRLYMTDGVSLAEYDLSRADPMPASTPGFGGQALRWVGDHLLSGASLLDVRVPGDPAIVRSYGSVLFDGYSYEVAVQGELFLGVPSSGKSLLTMAGADAAPGSALAKRFDWPSRILGVAAHGDRVVVLESSRLSVIELNDVGEPLELGALLLPDLGDGSRYLSVLGDFAAIASESERSLTVVRLSDPAHMAVTDTLLLGKVPRAMVAGSDALYLTLLESTPEAPRNRTEHLASIAVSGAGRSLQTGTLELPSPSSLQYLAWHDGWLYGSNRVSAYSSQTGRIPPLVRIFDVSVPDTPVLAGDFQLESGDFPPTPDLMLSSGNELIVRAGAGSPFYTFDLEDPSAPVPSGTIELFGVSPAAIWNEQLILSGATVAVYDLNVRQPKASYELGNASRSALVVGDQLVLGAGEQLVTLQLAGGRAVP